jgi:transposase InsO family protein
MLPNCKYLVHDRDSLYTEKFENTFKDFGITPIKTPPRSPNLNPFAERVIRSIKYECLSNMIIFSEKRLRNILKEYIEHYHFERNHQGIGNEIIESENEILKHSKSSKDPIVKKERIGGLLNYYYRQSA